MDAEIVRKTIIAWGVAGNDESPHRGLFRCAEYYMNRDGCQRRWAQQIPQLVSDEPWPECCGEPAELMSPLEPLTVLVPAAG